MHVKKEVFILVYTLNTTFMYTYMSTTCAVTFGTRNNRRTETQATYIHLLGPRESPLITSGIYITLCMSTFSDDTTT